MNIPPDSFDDNTRHAFIDDLEEWLGIPHPRLRIQSVQPSVSGDPSSSLVLIAVPEGPGKSTEELSWEMKSAVETGQLAGLGGAVNFAATRRLLCRRGRFTFSACELIPSRFIVHDPRSLAERQKDATRELQVASAELRSLHHKEQMATTAQVMTA